MTLLYKNSDRHSRESGNPVKSSILDSHFRGNDKKCKTIEITGLMFSVFQTLEIPDFQYNKSQTERLLPAGIPALSLEYIRQFVLYLLPATEMIQ